MQSKATTANDYVLSLPEERQSAITTLRELCVKHIKGIEETMNYGMLTYVVPHSIYPAGYHCDPKLALPFISIASQKNFIALYHMGIYSKPDLLDWFVQEFPKHSTAKLDMGKSCIRFKKSTDIPFKLIEHLLKKMTMKQWIATYESVLKNSRKK
jgi:hypothetical protein